MNVSAGVLVLCLSLGVRTSSAQLSQVLSIPDGLPSYAVTSLLQDRTGFVWVGTTDGLGRFDGYEFDIYRHEPGNANSLSNSLVNTHSLVEDARGNIWIGTREGLNRLDPRTGVIERFLHDPARPESLTDHHIRQIIPEPDGSLWIATLEGGVNRFDPALGVFTPLLADSVDAGAVPLQRTRSLLRNDAGLWIGTVKGLALVSEDGQQIVPVPLDAPEPILYSLLEDRSGIIWAGGTGVVYRYNPATREVRRIPLVPSEEETRYILDLFEDTDGTIRVGTWGSGYFELNPSTGAVLRHHMPGEERGALPSHRVSVFMRDRTDVLWVGTWDGLVRRPIAKPFSSTSFEARVSSTFVEEDGSLWVTTIGSGLFQIRPTGVTPYGMDEGLPTLDAMSVMRDGAGDLWVGTATGGIWHVGARKGKKWVYSKDKASTPPLRDNLFYKVYEDRRGRIWLGTVHDGLAVIDQSRSQVAYYLHDPGDPESIPSNEVWTVYEDSRDRMWIGTIGGGLVRLRFEQEETFPPDVRFEQVGGGSEAENGLRSKNVVSIHEDQDGALWIGTMGGGLGMLDQKTGRIFSYTEADGLPDDRVQCIQSDDRGRLWLGTGNGLVRFDRVAFDRTRRPIGVFRTYTLEDGLPGMVFFGDGCSRGADGRLHFAVDNSVLSFEPTAFEDNLRPPVTVLNDVRLFNARLPMDTLAAYKRQLHLAHDENFLAFRFAALDFTAPRKNRFEYRMEGIDEEWVRDLGGRLASYPNLSPGSYTFRVRAVNNDGVVGTDTRLEIEIETALSQTWWFRAIIGVLLGGILSVPFVQRRRQQKALLRTRQQIADDLHDDIGSRLSGMAMFFDRLLRNGALPPSETSRARDYMSAARRMADDLRDHVWVIEPANDTLGQLAEQIEATAHTFVSSGVLEFRLGRLDAAQKLSMDLRRDVFMMYKEALHNALRHSEASRIRVDVNQAGRWLDIVVADNGIGFDTEAGAHGHGMHTLPRRAERIGARLDVVSAPGKGTEVRISIFLT